MVCRDTCLLKISDALSTWCWLSLGQGNGRELLETAGSCASTGEQPLLNTAEDGPSWLCPCPQPLAPEPALPLEPRSHESLQPERGNNASLPQGKVCERHPMGQLCPGPPTTVSKKEAPPGGRASSPGACLVNLVKPFIPDPAGSLGLPEHSSPGTFVPVCSVQPLLTPSRQHNS